MRCAIYARYSSDQQRAASIEDQLEACRRHAASQGWTVIEVYADRGQSGASRFRPGYQRLLEQVRTGGRFEVVLAEALDRLSRDQEDVAALFKQLGFAGVALVTLAEGAITELHVGLTGTMNALFLKQLAQKTRRGLAGRVRQGRSGGGLCYGYAVVRRLGPDGAPETGLRAEEERLRALNAVGVFLESADGKLIWEYDERALESYMLPKPLLRITFEIGLVARFLEPPRKLPNSATVLLDFGRPPAFDTSDPSIAPTPNASSIVVYGTDETWVYGVSSSLESLISQSKTHWDWLHARHTYPILLFILGIPGALSASGLLHNWLGQDIQQAAGGFVATSFVVIIFVLFVYLFRLCFSLLRWLYPYIEMTGEPKPLYVRLRNVWSAVLLGIPGSVIATGVVKLVGW